MDKKELKARHQAERKLMRAALAGDGEALQELDDLAGDSVEASLPDTPEPMALECDPVELSDEAAEAIIERLERECGTGS